MKCWNVAMEGGVVTAAHDNPPMNYFTAEGAAELAELIEQWADPQVRAIVLTGAVPGRFITHYSVEELAALAADPGALAALGTGLNTGYYDLLRWLRGLGKPVIAAINGDAMGGGFELCLWCDIRILARGDYRVGLPETRLGIIPGGSGTQMLARLLGPGKAIEVILRGSVLDPEAALAAGLVHELADDACARAQMIARDLATLSPKAMAAAKIAVYDGADLPLDAGLMVEAGASVGVIGSREGLAFMTDYLAQPLEARRAWLDRGV